jgi:hypothetical protein
MNTLSITNYVQRLHYRGQSPAETFELSIVTFEFNARDYTIAGGMSRMRAFLFPIPIARSKQIRRIGGGSERGIRERGKIIRKFPEMDGGEQRSFLYFGRSAFDKWQRPD